MDTELAMDTESDLVNPLSLEACSWPILWGGPQCRAPRGIQPREARRVCPLAFPSMSSQWLPILELDYATPRVLGVTYYRKKVEKFG